MRFVNVDLEVEFRADPTALIEALEPRAMLLHVQRVGRLHRATFELLPDPKDSATAIRRFVALIEKLPPPARALFDRARSRAFDIGVEVSAKKTVAVQISTREVRNAARVNAAIAVTAYRR